MTEIHYNARLRRHQVLCVSPELMLQLILSNQEMPKSVVRVSRVANLPPWVEVESASWDEYRQCYSFVLYHPSFPAVPLGETIPVVEATIETKLFAVLGEQPQPDQPHEVER